MPEEKKTVSFRIALMEDWFRIIDIYNQSVNETGKTADTDPQTVESKNGWLKDHLDEKYPIIIAEINGQMVGWCSLSKYRPGRKALASTAEISYYLDKQYRGSGIGTSLIEEAISYAKDHGIKNLMAVLLDINEASSRILTKFGFVKWGHLPNIAEINGSTCGQFIFGKNIMQ